MLWIYIFQKSKFTIIFRAQMVYTSEVKYHIKCLGPLHREYKLHPTEYRAVAIKNSKIDLKSKVNNAKIAYESNNLLFNNFSIICNHIRSITKAKFIPSIITFYDKQTCGDSTNLTSTFIQYLPLLYNNDESLNIDSFPNILNSLSTIDFSETEVYSILHYPI